MEHYLELGVGRDSSAGPEVENINMVVVVDGKVRRKSLKLGTCSKKLSINIQSKTGKLNMLLVFIS